MRLCKAGLLAESTDVCIEQLHIAPIVPSGASHISLVERFVPFSVLFSETRPTVLVLVVGCLDFEDFFGSSVNSFGGTYYV